MGEDTKMKTAAMNSTVHRTKTDMVTGAFSHTGRYIARELLTNGREVRTLTGHPNRPHEFGNKIPAHPYSFDNPDRLAASLEGIDTLYNSYWVRFDFDGITHEKAVRNTQTLIRAAVKAKVRKIVQISIANPSKDSSLRYYSGKWALEQAVIKSGLQYTILRPTVIFGPEGLLINNIAWMLKRFPVFAIPGSGQYGIQPIFVEDLRDLAIAAGDNDKNEIMDAVGPETFTYEGFIKEIARALGVQRPLVHLPPALIRSAAWVLGSLVHDIVLTPEEIAGLMDGLLVSNRPPTGKTRFCEWLRRNKDQLGVGYQSELRIHFEGLS